MFCSFHLAIQLNAQKQFKIIITKPSNLANNKFSFSISDCSSYIIVNDSFINNKLIITGKYLSKYVGLVINYNLNNDTLGFSNEFFINSMQAKIKLVTVKKNNRDIVDYKIENTLDYTKSDFHWKLQEFCKDEHMAMKIFWDKHASKWYKDDSLKQVFKYTLEKINNKYVDFIKQYPNSYFSIWLFKTHVVVRADAENSFTLLKDFNEIFTTQLKETYEGKEINRILTGFVNAKINNKAPDIIAKDINGQTIQLSDYKNKFVLLVFWASWCAPCREEIPVINKLREEFPEDKLKIIGITSDDNLQSYLSAIAKNNMKWIHLKRDKRLNQIYGVNAIPTTFLINKEGIIVDDSYFVKQKISELIKKL